MFMEIYYEDYHQHSALKSWMERRTVPYMVLERDPVRREEFKDSLKSHGFRVVAWNPDYPGILVNLDLKRVALIEKPCKHSCVGDRDYTIAEFTEEVLSPWLEAHSAELVPDSAIFPLCDSEAPEGEEPETDGALTYVRRGDGYVVTGAVGALGETLVIPSEFGGKKVLGVAARAFFERNEIRELVVSDGVRYIGYDSFMRCKNLGVVRVPATMEYFGEYAFCGSVSVKEVHAPDLSSWMGARFVNSASNPFFSETEFFVGGSPLKDVVIPEGTEAVGDYAFGGLNSVESVTVPPSLRKIGRGAFLCCEGLKEVRVSDIAAWCSVELGDADANPLVSAKNLVANGEPVTNLVIPDGITSIGRWAFAGCGHVRHVSFSPSVNFVGQGAFAMWESLERASLPKGIASVEPWTFVYCRAMEAVEIPRGVRLIGEGAFRGCSNLARITLPEGVETIEPCAFEGCSGLEKISVPATFSASGYNAFSDCDSLSGVYIEDLGAWCRVAFSGPESSPLEAGKNLYLKGVPVVDLVVPDGVTEVSGSVLEGCTSIRSARVPCGVTKIGDRAFRGCANLSEAILPDTVSEVGESAFGECASLKRAKLGNGCRSVGKFAFCDCVSLESIRVPEGATHVGFWAFCGCTSLRSAFLPDSLETVEEKLFSGCSALSEVRLGKRVSKIEEGAFSGCVSLKVLDFPKSVREIGARAFASSGLEEAVLPNGVKSMGKEVFAECRRLSRVSLPKSLAILEDGMFSGCSALKDVGFPEKIVSVGDWAFKGCVSLEKTAVPHGAVYVGMGAFYGCTSLKRLILPENLKAVSAYLAYGCESLEGVYIPGRVTYVGEYAFFGCTSFTSVYLPHNVIDVGRSAYEGCASVRSVVFRDGLEDVGEDTFRNCSALERALFPDTVSTIGRGAFDGCVSLKEARLPKGIAHVDMDMFFGCTSLEKVNVPGRVDAICAFAFYRCSSLTSIILPESLYSIDVRAFLDCTSLEKVFFRGTAKKWEDVSVNDDNGGLTNARLYFYSENEPGEKGNFWHFGASGGVEIWREDGDEV